MNNINKINNFKNFHNKRLQQAKANIPKEYVNFAKGMEKQFAEFMISQMKSSSGINKTDTAGSYYDSLMTQQEANKLVANGLGISELILKQMLERSGGF